MPQPVHITFIHGLANKPAPKDLRRIWLDALKARVDGDDGFDPGAVGVTDSFVYWADLFFDEPIASSAYESRSDELQASVAEDPDLKSNEWIEKMRKHFPDEDEAAVQDAPVDDTTEGYERIPVPWFIKRRVMRHFLKEAHDYFFNVNNIRDTIWDRIREDFGKVPADARHMLVGHSQGSFIAYDALTGMSGGREMDGLLTLGSPLGLDEVQDQLTWTRENGFPAKLRGDWVNVFDSFDIVSRADPKLANDFLKNGEQAVIDINEQNWGKWRHSATKYFKGPELRRALRRLCDREGA